MFNFTRNKIKLKSKIGTKSTRYRLAIVISSSEMNQIKIHRTAPASDGPMTAKYRPDSPAFTHSTSVSKHAATDNTLCRVGRLPSLAFPWRQRETDVTGEGGRGRHSRQREVTSLEIAGGDATGDYLRDVTGDSGR